MKAFKIGGAVVFARQRILLDGKKVEDCIRPELRYKQLLVFKMDMAKVETDLADQDSDPDSIKTLKEEMANLKAEAEYTALDLEDAQKRNGRLQEEIEDLQSVQAVLRT